MLFSTVWQFSVSRNRVCTDAVIDSATYPNNFHFSLVNILNLCREKITNMTIITADNFIRRWWILLYFNYSIEEGFNVFSAGASVTRIRGGLNRTHLCFSFIGGAHQVSVKLWKVVNSKKDQRNSSRLEIMSSKWTFLKLIGKLGTKHLAIQLNIDAWFWNLITVLSMMLYTLDNFSSCF